MGHSVWSSCQARITTPPEPQVQLKIAPNVPSFHREMHRDTIRCNVFHSTFGGKACRVQQSIMTLTIMATKGKWPEFDGVENGRFIATTTTKTRLVPEVHGSKPTRFPHRYELFVTHRWNHEE